MHLITGRCLYKDSSTEDRERLSLFDEASSHVRRVSTPTADLVLKQPSKNDQSTRIHGMLAIRSKSPALLPNKPPLSSGASVPT
jgi:hypothetical protein